MADGQYVISAGDLQGFLDSGQEFWWMNRDGSTDVYTDDRVLTQGWPVYLTRRDDNLVDAFGSVEAAAEFLTGELRKNAECLPK